MQDLLRCFFILVVMVTISSAQSTIDNSFVVEGTEKNYSLYIPSSYDSNISSKLMLGLHPLNPSRWNSTSWRDTLINFAESNNLILACPDGGSDGRIDDPIDTLFTSMLLDSVANWFNIDNNNKYIMGFSWGGKTTYTYGLRRPDQFAGYLVIGAAINGINEVQDIIQNAKGENFYLVHGSQDNVTLRYTQMLEALTENDACVESNLLTGIGHTIDFPNRNEILTDAFEWLTTNACNTTSTYNNKLQQKLPSLYPNPNNGTFYFVNEYSNVTKSIRAFNFSGQELPLHISNNMVSLENDISGIIFINIITKEGESISERLIVRP